MAEFTSIVTVTVSEKITNRVIKCGGYALKGNLRCVPVP